MATFKLAFGIHNHQPVGNFEAVFEEAHQRAYVPFLRLLDRFPHIRTSLHQSGILWRWQEKAHPEYFELVGKLLDRGQIELLTGGFYEPILTAIPERDGLGQIGMLSQYLRRHFEVEARGLWLTERVWEPHLPKLLANAGVEFLPVDDTHFLFTGMELSQLTGPFVTEHEGETVKLLPIQKRLRYLIPFGKVDEVITELKRQAERRPDGIAVYADDGEKFGVWPKTYAHCYEDRWLEQFFDALGRNADWLEVVPLHVAADAKPVGRVYLPSASYEEMLHWSLPQHAYVEYEQFEHWLKDSGEFERYGRFVRGAHWRAFLAKYDEANLMHKKMLFVSDKLADVRNKPGVGEDALRVAQDRLYASQCNCPYWHGVFGGLYLPHIRQAVYGAMIEADAELRRVSGESGVRFTTLDYDADGFDEVVAQTESFAAVFAPDRGGILLDLALNRHGFDLTDTLTRRREGYHRKLAQAVTDNSTSQTASIHDLVLAKEAGLSRVLIEDWYLKRCFIDHFLARDTTLESFRSGTFRDDGDFVLEPYEFQIHAARNQVVLSRNGHVGAHDGRAEVRVVKRFSFDAVSEGISVEYDLSTRDQRSLAVDFAVENNFTFQAGHAEDRYIVVDNTRPSPSYLDAVGMRQKAHGLAMVDEYRGLAAAIATEQPVEFWYMPIFTVSLSEGGFEKVYQGTTIVSIYHLQLSERPVLLKMTLHAGAMRSVLDSVFRTSAVAAR